MITAQEQLTQDFEQAFGDPALAANGFSFDRCEALDAVSAFPQELVDRLNQWGVLHYFVPQQWGGKLQAYEDLFVLTQLMARRDLTAAIGYSKTFLGSISVWLAGTDEQCLALAKRVLTGDVVALALTEKEHGSDVLANELVAIEQAGQYYLTGEKHYINNAQRSQHLVVFARTQHTGSPRDFSLFLVSKAALSPASYSALAKIKTHGIKGADISGIRFTNACLPTGALLGEPGHGLDTVLRGFQITRTLCAGLSCGATDTALRLTLAFAKNRTLYGNPLMDLLPVRRAVAGAYADLLVCEVLSRIATRAINVLPRQMSLISAIVKGWVPARLEAAVDSLADVMGARGFLEDTVGVGTFAKLLRDIRLVAVFDGNTLVNLQALLLELPTIAMRRLKQAALPKDVLTRLRICVDVSQPVASLKRADLSLSAKGQDVLGQALKDLVAAIQLAPVPSDVLEPLKQEVTYWQAEQQELDEFFQNRHVSPAHLSKQDFELAKRYASLYAMQACLAVFVWARATLQPPYQDGLWLLACSRHLRGQTDQALDSLLALLKQADSQDNLLSVWPRSLASSNAVEQLHV